MRFRLVRHGVVDSTSERAFASIAAGEARHGDVHTAAAQDAGRGRLGRSWYSPRDEGVYLSLVLLPPPPPSSPAALTIAAGLAVLDSVLAIGARGARLRWPNDVVVDDDLGAGDAKLAGVLVETRGFVPDRPHYVVGIGLNVRQREFPVALRAERRVTSLALLGLDVRLATAEERVLEALPGRFRQAASDHATLAADFLRATGLAGADVRVRIGAEEREGAVAGLSIAEGLLLRASDGRESRLPLELVREIAPGVKQGEKQPGAKPGEKQVAKQVARQARPRARGSL